MSHKEHAKLSRQSGAVLMTALALLMVLTLLGVAAMENTIMEERMAGNFRDQQVGFEAAEAALRSGEVALWDNVAYAALPWDGSDDYSYPGDPSVNPFTTDGTEVTDSDLLVEDAGAPVFFVERLAEFEKTNLLGESSGTGFGPGAFIHYYRVTARGFGRQPNTEVVLQSTFFRN